MKTPTTRAQCTPVRRARQAGAAAVELSVLMLATLVLIIPTFVIGRTLWQYNVLKHATYDAARYIAAVPLYELRDFDVDVQGQAKLMVARTLIAAGVAPASSQGSLVGLTEVTCAGPVVGCRTATPETITVKVSIQVSDPVSLGIVGRLVQLTAVSTVRYAN